MKKILFLMLLCLPFIAMAQTDPKYLAGAITMDDVSSPKASSMHVFFTPMKMKEPLQQVAKNIWYSPPLHCHWTEPEFIISCLSPAKTENVISK